MQSAPATTKITLGDLDPMNWPIIWLWMEQSWKMVANDDSPRDLDSFVEMKRSESAPCLGVYLDGRLVGFLTISPVAFVDESLETVVGEGHRLFARRALRPEQTREALEMGIACAFGTGFERIIARIYPDNRAMLRLLLKLGAVLDLDENFQTRRDGELVGMMTFNLNRR